MTSCDGCIGSFAMLLTVILRVARVVCMEVSGLSDEPREMPDLVAETRQLLARLDLPRRDGRATPAPGPRTVRYYVSVGVVDPPLSHRGPRALYGVRHVLQVVAAKVLQADGLRLAEVAERLHGLDADQLAALIPEPGPPVVGEAAELALPAGAEVRLQVRVQPGLDVAVDPALLARPGNVPLLADAIGAALDRVARALADGPPIPGPPAP